MDLIEKLNLAEFHKYLRATDNTICGRYPISLLLAVRTRDLLGDCRREGMRLL